MNRITNITSLLLCLSRENFVQKILQHSHPFFWSSEVLQNFTHHPRTVMRRCNATCRVTAGLTGLQFNISFWYLRTDAANRPDRFTPSPPWWWSHLIQSRDILCHSAYVRAFCRGGRKAEGGPTDIMQWSHTVCSRVPWLNTPQIFPFHYFPLWERAASVFHTHSD